MEWKQSFGRFRGWRFKNVRPKYPKHCLDSSKRQPEELRARVLVEGCYWYDRPERVRKYLDRLLKNLFDPIVVFGNEFRGFGTIVDSYCTWNWLAYRPNVPVGRTDASKRKQRRMMMKSLLKAESGMRFAVFFWDQVDAHVEALIDSCIEEGVPYRVVKVVKKRRHK